MKFPTIILLVVGLSGCCSLCRHDNAPTYLMDHDFKDNILFPTGSYWVYFTDSGQKDSVQKLRHGYASIGEAKDLE